MEDGVTQLTNMVLHQKSRFNWDEIGGGCMLGYSNYAAANNSYDKKTFFNKNHSLVVTYRADKLSW